MKEATSALILLAALAAVPVLGATTDEHETEVYSYLEWRYGALKPSLQRRIQRNAAIIVPVLLDKCKKYNVDPLHMVVFFHSESGWRNFKGKRGELGPGQVMPGGPAQKHIGLETLEQQTHASVWVWATALRACKTLEQSVTYYMRGTCTGGTSHTKTMVRARMRQFNKVVEKFRGAK